MTKRNPEFGGFSACFAVRAETDRKGKATPPARTETAMCEPVDWIYSDFNPLRPRGRRLRSGAHPLNRYFISTHSAREDGDCVPLTIGVALQEFQPTPPARTETAILHKKTNNSSSHFHNQITSYPLKSPPTYPAHIQNRSHCAVFPVRIPP